MRDEKEGKKCKRKKAGRNENRVHDKVDGVRKREKKRVLIVSGKKRGGDEKMGREIK